jgi:DNA polymerase-3 subunit epsilon
MISNKRLYIDTETTGTTSNSAVLQIAGIIEVNGEVKRTFEINMTPHLGADIQVNKDFHRVNGTKNVISQKRGYELFKRELEVYVNKFNPKEKFHFLAYNAPFDGARMYEFFRRNGDNFFHSYFFRPYICLMQRAAWVLAEERHLLPNFKLGTVCDHVGIDIDPDQLHDGTYDITKSRELKLKLDEIVLKRMINGRQ